MKLIDLSWGLSVLGIMGSILNIRKKKSCFLIWNIGNIGWMLLAIWIPEFRGQAPLWLVFTILNTWGYFAWRKL
jgi:nicotinamide riboside transporter PnuC